MRREERAGRAHGCEVQAVQNFGTTRDFDFGRRVNKMRPISSELAAAPPQFGADVVLTLRRKIAGHGKPRGDRARTPRTAGKISARPAEGPDHRDDCVRPNAGAFTGLMSLLTTTPRRREVWRAPKKNSSPPIRTRGAGFVVPLTLTQLSQLTLPQLRQTPQVRRGRRKAKRRLHFTERDAASQRHQSSLSRGRDSA
jgi:hypothetical protein